MFRKAYDVIRRKFVAGLIISVFWNICKCECCYHTGIVVKTSVHNSQLAM